MKQCSQFLLLFLLIKFSLLGQAPDRFIQTYNFPPNINSQSYGVANTDYGYMLAGISADSIDNQSGYFAYTVSGHDHMGNLLWYKRHQMSPDESMLAGWYIHDFLKPIKGYYYSTFNVHNTITNAYTSYLLKLNNQGDTIWTKHYVGEAQDSLLETRSISTTNDGGFILSGITSPLNGDQKIFLLKTDSLGNTQWKKKYNLSNQIEQVFSAIQDSISSRIIMVGYKNNNPTSFLCILDSLGVMLQQKNFNTTNGGYLYNVGHLFDGDFVAVGAEMTGNVQGGFDLTKQMSLKFDINGNLIWKNVSGYESIDNSFFSILVETGDTIVAVGYSDTTYTQNLGFNGVLSIQKMSSSGTIIWSRIIDVFNNNPANAVFQAIVKTADGGYATTGYDFMAASPDPFVLIKLDEWACLNESCQTAGIEEYLKVNGISIFPNPASETFTISLPDNTSTTDCILFDNAAQEVMRFTVSGGENLVDVTGLECGIYMMQINSQISKLIKN